MTDTPRVYRKRVRCKASCGLTLSWTLYERDGVWHIGSVGNARRGRFAVPADFIPFELANVVLSERPQFLDLTSAENYVRSL
jgi:hypothetical protein